MLFLEKLVVRTAVKTVLIILGIFLVVFAVFNFAFPQHMATITESTGNYTLAVKYADLRYTYSKECGDLSRCYDDSVFTGDVQLILKYGEKLISDEDFYKVCDEKSKTYAGYNYKNWVYSKYCAAMYDKGDKNEAIKIAIESNGAGSFKRGNAVMSLASKINGAKDSDSAAKLLNYIENGVPELNVLPITPKEQTDIDDLKVVKTALKGLIDNK